MQTLKSDEGAHFDRIVKISSADISPTVSWGTSPQDVLPISGSVPRPEDSKTADQQAAVARALAYMGLEAGMPLEQVKIDKVGHVSQLLVGSPLETKSWTSLGLHRILHQLAYRGFESCCQGRCWTQGGRWYLRHGRSWIWSGQEPG